MALSPFFVLLGWLAGVAFAGPPGAERLEALVGPGQLADGDLAALAEHGDWRVRQEVALIEAWRDDPGFCGRMDGQVPIETRAGLPRFTGSAVQDARVAALFLERYRHGGEPASVRGALVEALPRTGGDWSEAIAALLAEEEDPWVRAAMAGVLAQAEPGPAARGLARASVDPDPGVRAAAVRAMGWRADRAVYLDLLVLAASDPDPAVRSGAVRGLGLFVGEARAWAAVEPCLADGDAEVRLRAVHAAGRIDPERAAASPALRVLVSDPDARVARAAARLAGR